MNITQCLIDQKGYEEYVLLRDLFEDSGRDRKQFNNDVCQGCGGAGIHFVHYPHWEFWTCKCPEGMKLEEFYTKYRNDKLKQGWNMGL